MVLPRAGQARREVREVQMARPAPAPPARSSSGQPVPGASAWQRVRGRPSSEGTAPGLSTGEWAGGGLVRPYTMTGGRTRPTKAVPDLDMLTIVVAAGDTGGHTSREPEQAAILRLCRSPVSVAEISAKLDIPITVVKVLLGDLVAEGDVRTRAPLPPADLPDANVLQAVLDGIRRL